MGFPTAFGDGKGRYRVVNKAIKSFASWATKPGVQMVAVNELKRKHRRRKPRRRRKPIKRLRRRRAKPAKQVPMPRTPIGLWNPTFKRFLRMSPSQYLDKSAVEVNAHFVKTWQWEKF